MSVVALALGAARAADPGLVEFEIRQGFRSQRVAAEVSPGILGIQSTFGITADARFRLSTQDRRFGLELQGAGDWLTAVAGFRPERWGSLRALYGVQGRTPLTTTLFHVAAGVRTLDVRHLAEADHVPVTTVTLGGELRRLGQGRYQALEGDLFVGDHLLGGTLRTTFGFGIGDTGWFATFGASSQRLGEFPPGSARDLLQVSHQAETSMVFQPRAMR